MGELVSNLYPSSNTTRTQIQAMATAPFTGKERIGRIAIERFRDKFLRLRWTLNGKTYSLTVGSDDRNTLRAARAKAQEIDSDITFGRFDPTLEKYGKQNKTTVLEVVTQQTRPSISLMDLWLKFYSDKAPHLKAKSDDEYRNFTKLLEKVENQFNSKLSFNGLETKQQLLGVTTVNQTKRMLTYLSAACNWGIKHKLIVENPFAGLAAELPKRQSDENPNPNAFSEDEMLAVIHAFKTDSRPGMDYSHYAPIVEFWFLTGCRPSEAIGLTWGCVNDDCSQVTYKGSVQIVRGKQQWSDKSKNNKTRTIAVSRQAQQLLLDIKPSDPKADDWAFPSPKRQAINYQNFQSKIWHKVVDSIKPDTTPYNARDTFITNQLLKGVSSAIVAKWCDTSTKMIDKRYADKLKLAQIRPVD